MDNNKCVPFVIMLCENCHVFFHFCISSSHAPTVPLMGNWCCPWIGRLNAVFWLSCNMSLPLSLYEKGGGRRCDMKTALVCFIKVVTSFIYKDVYTENDSLCRLFNKSRKRCEINSLCVYSE